MRISDWSSDVCSSDLGRDGGDPARRGGDHAVQGARAESRAGRGGVDVTPAPLDRRGLWMAVGAFVIWGVMPLYWHLLKSVPSLQIKIGRASCRERVCQYV